MSDFEEKAYFEGFNDNEDYLNHLCDEGGNLSFYQEDSEESDEEYKDKNTFTINKESIYNKAKSVLDNLYWSYNKDEYSCGVYKYRYKYLNDVLFIEMCQDDFIEALHILDWKARHLFFDYQIIIEIDPYYSSAEIKALTEEAFLKEVLK